jgi:benzylsuccinate CoA-transferase BbsF subunit
MGREDLIEDKGYRALKDRKLNEENLEKILINWTQKQDPEKAAEKLQEAGIGAFPVFSIEEVNADAHFLARGLFEEKTHEAYGKTRIYSTPWRFSELRGEIGEAPLMGEHNGYVFKELLGMSEEKIKKLEEAKVIY